MHSTTFLTLSCLFPVFISGYPTFKVWRRDGDDQSSNSTVSTGPSGDSTSGTDLLALDLMTLVFNLADFFYNASIDLSNTLADPETAAVLGVAKMMNEKDMGLLDQPPEANCTWNINPLLDQSNSRNLIASALHLEQIKAMGVSAVLQNQSISVSTEDTINLNSILADTSETVTLLGNMSIPSVPVLGGIYPNITIADFFNLIRKFKPVCDPSFDLLNSLPTTSTLGTTTPYVLAHNFQISITFSGCANSSVPAFCQFIGSDPNVPATVTPLPNCITGPTIGANLLYITSSDDPLSNDVGERAGQQSSMCLGPDLFVLHG